MSTESDDDVIEFTTPSTIRNDAELKAKFGDNIPDTIPTTTKSTSTTNQTTPSSISTNDQSKIDTNDDEKNNQDDEEQFTNLTVTNQNEDDYIPQQEPVSIKVDNLAQFEFGQDEYGNPIASHKDIIEEEISDNNTNPESTNININTTNDNNNNTNINDHNDHNDNNNENIQDPTSHGFYDPNGNYHPHEQDNEPDFNFDPDPIRSADAKARGNKHFAQGHYEDALECYAEALLFCPEELIAERILYHNNKCAAHIMLKQWEDAIFEAQCVLGLDDKNIKAYTRRAKAYENMESYLEAIEDYKQLAILEPHIRLYKEKEIELTKKNEEKYEKQKDEMVGKLKGWGNSFLGMFGMSTDNFQFNQDPNTGSYSVNFVQNPGETQQPGQQQPPQAGPQQPGSNSFSFTTGGKP